MNLLHQITRPRRFIGALITALALTSSLLFGQGANTGTITGRVYEEATGRSLQGATVKVAGSTASAVTDAEGRYRLQAVPAGSYTVEVEYIGLDLLKIPVTVSAGGNVAIDAGLKSEVLKMQAFEVAE